MSETQNPTVHPVILSGGAGTRLWPMSRKAYPKQLLPLETERTMLQETALRVAGGQFSAPTIVCNDEHRFIVAEQLRAADIMPKSIFLEPLGRNTAPAAAIAALAVGADDPDAIILLLASDSAIAKPDVFRNAVEIGARAAAGGALVTFGIPAPTPETGYGYVRRGAPIPGIEGCFQVDSFVEKPDRETAERYLAEGGYFWNSGTFMFSASKFLAELERFEPDLLDACRNALADGTKDLDFFRLDREAFAQCPSLSIDYAVMEHTASAAVVPADMGWNDVGSWAALWDIGNKNDDNNVTYGDIITKNVKNSYIRTDGRMAAVMGISDAVVIVTDDVVLVAGRDDAQDVKSLVDRLEREGRTEHLRHTTVYRPWGRQRAVDKADRFEVKRITVQPGARLSLHRHQRRAEHWIVVSGTAGVTRGEEKFVLGENQSSFIPSGVIHRLENAGSTPLEIIEVRTGRYLGEDDVERLDDAYGRTCE
ncbi:MAG: mannose-1-phosphate guanylyltransferase/mannose-6-phosphate isomerase [Rhodospirillales bacterium]|jgi:mannose-1-phosphate guanylyltransferase / mannose-6-phosphate isomerase|nr:mannose-1-phosphate guanylyltransferase/mannose-6-phosphate isomerase [Rhodospirillales bacterium]